MDLSHEETGEEDKWLAAPDASDDDLNEEGNSSNNDEAIRTYIRHQLKKHGGVSTENVRKTFGIGWIRAKRLHDQEMGLKTDEVRYASDDKLRRYIRQCFDEKGSCSVNHLRQEFNVGYNRAKKILDEEKGRADWADGEDGGALLLGSLGQGDEGTSPTPDRKQHAKARGKGKSSQASTRSIYAPGALSDEARIQGLEEDASYLLGLGMGLSVTQQRERGRTEDENICGTALETLLSINGSAATAPPLDQAAVSGRSSRVRPSETKWAKFEKAREDLQQKLDEFKEVRKKRRAEDPRAEGRRRRASKALEVNLGVDMEQLKAKLAEIEDLRDQLGRELKRVRDERAGVLVTPPPQERTENDTERMLTRKRRREGYGGAAADTNPSFAERLHKLIQTIADLEVELREQQEALSALSQHSAPAYTIAPCGSLSSASSSSSSSSSSWTLSSSLLSSCLLQLTCPPGSMQSDAEVDDEGEDVASSPAFNSAPASPEAPPLGQQPVTLTYAVPTLSSQEFIKSLEALTSTSSSALASAFAALPGSLSFTIPCAPPPSLASSLTFTALPPPLPTYPADTAAVAAAAAAVVAATPASSLLFFPPPPLPTLAMSSFPHVAMGFPTYGADYLPVVPPSNNSTEEQVLLASTTTKPTTTTVAAGGSEQRTPNNKRRRVARNGGSDKGRDDALTNGRRHPEANEEDPSAEAGVSDDEWRVEKGEAATLVEKGEAPAGPRRRGRGAQNLGA